MQTHEDDQDQPALLGLEAQTREFRDAIKQALTAVNLEISANDGQPQIDAVTAALTSVLAEFIAMQPSRNVRRLQIAHCDRDLKRLVSLRAGAAP